MSDEDLVQALRASIMPSNNLKQRAADAIERLTRERDELDERFTELFAASVNYISRKHAAERKVEMLRAAIRSAYVEGWTDATSRDDPRGSGVIDQEWETSLARAALDGTGE